MDGYVPKGRGMADTWWGKAWVANLESYADYANRISRGRSYLRGGRVLNIEIDEGKVSARVQGSRSRPYRVTVDIQPLSEERKAEVCRRCGNRIENLDSLLAGNIPSDIADLFVSRDGLFPSPKEIYFKCTCPDWAYMCKHVAAVLYGIGVAFDHDPMLFFRLRGTDVDSLIKRSVQEKVESMMRNSDVRSPRIIDDSRLSGLFGVL